MPTLGVLRCRSDRAVATPARRAPPGLRRGVGEEQHLVVVIGRGDASQSAHCARREVTDYPLAMGDSTISVRPLSGSIYEVAIEEGGTRTAHDVTVSPEHIARYAPGASAEEVLRASFEFLLEREPKESILRSFALPTIERYFPEYPQTIRERLSDRGRS